MPSYDKMHVAADEWLTTADLARITNTSVSFWEKLRVRGGKDSLPYSYIGRRVRYRRADVDAWLSARSKKSTSEGGGQ